MAQAPYIGKFLLTQGVIRYRYIPNQKLGVCLGAIRMAVVARQGEWYTVAVNGKMIGRFGALIDAHRFALGMLHDSLVASVELPSGHKIV